MGIKDTMQGETTQPGQDAAISSYEESVQAAEAALHDREGVDVVYHIDRIAYELMSALREREASAPQNASSELHLSGPSALVMVQGKTARQAYSVLADAGIATVMPLMGDWRLDSNPKFAFTTVKMGPRPTKRLYVNAYAVLQAAREAQVQSIFLAGDSLALAQDNRFLKRAHDQGLRVFRMLDIDTSYRGWVECEPSAEPDVKQPTTWRTCHSCKLTFDNAEFVENGYACPSCGTLARLSSDERIALVCDEGSFVEWDADIADVDPLEFPGYREKVAGYREKTGKHEAVRTGRALLGGRPAALGFMESDFMMGSMGSVVGEKVSRLFDRATEEGLPVIIFCASGGARMQEGLASLMQMAKTACAVERHDRAGLLYISVITDPTTGGVTASFATLADIIFAEPGALIGFAGQRVIRDTIKQDLPEGFQTAEFALEHGLIDAIVERDDLREVLRAGIAFHQPRPGDAEDELHVFSTLARERVSVQRQGGFIQNLLKNPLEGLPFADMFMKPEDTEERTRRDLERHAERELKRSGVTDEVVPGSAWESVQLARNVHRPTARTYINEISPSFLELHGDREFADDKAIIAGLGRIDGRPVTIIAQEKGTTLDERIERNFGCPQPEGYRKTARLMRQAEKFGRPIVCLVDTQGAFCGTQAEERGQGNAIAENLELMAGLRVPVVSVLLGEGGSGGALALALANRVAMQENAVYSVLSPEGFASILWKDGKRAPEAAEVMGMNSAEVLKLGVVDAVLPEGEGPAHENPEQSAEVVHAYIAQALEELDGYSPEELLVQRQQRFARF